jgi:probable F420-dependent oxidoreductase
MRFSFVIFGVPTEHSTPLVQQAEALGFHTVWFGDHVLTPVGHRSQYPYRPEAGYGPDTPLNDVWVSIAHAAALTSEIRLGTSVYVLPLRHPAVAAQAAATVQNLSGGRLVMGLGAGWLREEFDELGLDFKTRGARLDEGVDLLERLWSGTQVSYEGRHYRLAASQLGTVPSAPIPLTFGGSSTAALRRAATRGDGWNGPELTFDDNVRRRARLEELRTWAGRESVPFSLYVKPKEQLSRDLISRYVEAGFHDLVLPFGFAREDGRQRTLRESLDAVERLAELAFSPAE